MMLHRSNKEADIQVWNSGESVHLIIGCLILIKEEGLDKITMV
jgi:hypothetical protein